jgi:uncharacterized protein YceK
MKRLSITILIGLALITLNGCATRPTHTGAVAENALSQPSSVGWTLQLPRDLPE